ncbi:hypothetical protein L1887_33710 [Cichorium endivia]|nr:hypothetical protein L1887_33710 [Cichorium endivia]
MFGPCAADQVELAYAYAVSGEEKVRWLWMVACRVRKKKQGAKGYKEEKSERDCGGEIVKSFLQGSQCRTSVVPANELEPLEGISCSRFSLVYTTHELPFRE